MGKHPYDEPYNDQPEYNFEEEAEATNYERQKLSEDGDRRILQEIFAQVKNYMYKNGLERTEQTIQRDFRNDPAMRDKFLAVYRYIITRGRK